MRSERISVRITFFVLASVPAPVLAQAFSSEFFSTPVSEGWELLNQYCDPATWNNGGWYHQQLDMAACPGSTQGGHDSYRRSLEPLNGVEQFFLEFRVQTDGDRSEIPWGAPTVVAMGNFFGVSYHVTVAQDLVQFLRDVDLPILFVEIEPGVARTYRIELHPDRYAFYIDANLIDEDTPEGPFPAHDSLITWRGKSQDLPCDNAWDYLRYGVLAVDGSGDYDSDHASTHDDFYFFHECLTNERVGINGGPGNDAGPGCRWAKMEGADSDVDLADFAAFQNTFDGGQ